MDILAGFRGGVVVGDQDFFRNLRLILCGGHDLWDDRVVVLRLDEIGESNEGYLVKSHRD